MHQIILVINIQTPDYESLKYLGYHLMHKKFLKHNVKAH